MAGASRLASSFSMLGGSVGDKRGGKPCALVGFGEERLPSAFGLGEIRGFLGSGPI
jgi:hypothetical protein